MAGGYSLLACFLLWSCCFIGPGLGLEADKFIRMALQAPYDIFANSRGDEYSSEGLDAADSVFSLRNIFQNMDNEYNFDGYHLAIDKSPRNDSDIPGDSAECITDVSPLVSPILDFFTKEAAKYRQYDLTAFVSKLAFKLVDVVLVDCSKPIAQKLLINRPPKSEPFPNWGWQFLDAMAKPPTGIMGGQLQWVGSYEMCNKIDTSYIVNVNGTNTTRPIKGNYCRIMLGPINSTIALLRLGYGACLPHTCSKDALTHYLIDNPGIVATALGAVGLEVKEIFCGHELDYATDTRAQTAIAIMAILIVIVVCATIYDGLCRKLWLQKWIDEDAMFAPKITDLRNGVAKSSQVHTSTNTDVLRQTSIVSTSDLISYGADDGQNVLHQTPTLLLRLEAAFVGFSALTSFRKVCDVTHVGKHHIPTADAVRFLSLVYAMGGNTFLFGIIYTESITTSNLVAKMLELPHYFIFQPIVNFAFTADSLLVVSGIMVSYHWMRRVKKAGSVSVKHVLCFYVRRYWRLMPMMLLTIMLYSCLYKYLVSGPIIPKQITDAENCKVNWWTNLLMIGNLANTDAMCLAWTWYAPLLFQLQLITPLILVPFNVKKWLGWLVLGIFYAIHMITLSVIVDQKVHVPKQDFQSWYYDYLLTPWCRAGPYFIGLAAGIILTKRESIREKLSQIDGCMNILTKASAIVIWLIAILTIMGLTFGTYSYNKEENPVPWTREGNITHDVLARSAWGLAVAWMILASEVGLGGVIKSILSYSCFTPVSRLSYPVFIIHAIFIFRYAYSQFDTIYITFSLMLYVYFGHIIFVFLLGFIIALIFYLPFQGIDVAICAKTNMDIAVAGSHPEELKQFRANDETAPLDIEPIYDEPRYDEPIEASNLGEKTSQL